MDMRERILDAAMLVMADRGLARTTTKEIARAAGCSEPLLYRYFADKQTLFVDVLLERLPPITGWEQLSGRRTVRHNLAEITERLLEFYSRSFPIAASLFGDTALLAAHRSRIAELGGGPSRPADAVQHYLEAEMAIGRLAPRIDVRAVSRTVTGAALFEAFLASYQGKTVGQASQTAARIVETLDLSG